MFTESTKAELIAIIAEGVAKGLASRQPYEKSLPANVSGTTGGLKDSPEATGEPKDTTFEEKQMDLADEEAAEEAEKKAKRSAASKKAAATKKAKKEAAAKAEAEAEAKKPVEEDDDFDDFEEGVDAETVEPAPMSRDDFMTELKREAGKHPNGNIEGRKLAIKMTKEDFEVESFKEIKEDQFEAFVRSFKRKVAAI